MTRLKRLSSREILRALREFGFEVEFMRGSHAKLVRVHGADGRSDVREVLVVPLHRELRIGTVRAIYRQAMRFIPEQELRPHFLA